MQEEILSADAVKFPESAFRKAPEVLNAVHMVALSVAVLVLSMIDPIMLVAVENETVVSPPGIGVDRGSSFDQALDNRHQLALPGIFNDLCIDPSLTLENPEDWDLVRASPTLVIVSRTEVTLIQLDLSLHLAVDRFLVRHNPLPEELVVPVDCHPTESCQSCCLGCREIVAEAPKNFSQSVITDFPVPDHKK